jgi:hypothetical protein
MMTDDDSDSENPYLANSFTQGNSDEFPYPWDDVNACRKRKLDGSKYVNHERCPKCRLASEKLTWIRFKSPPVTWEWLCGREGPLSICPDCNIQVEFILEVMS